MKSKLTKVVEYWPATKILKLYFLPGNYDESLSYSDIHNHSVIDNLFNVLGGSCALKKAVLHEGSYGSRKPLENSSRIRVSKSDFPKAFEFSKAILEDAGFKPCE